METEEPPTSRRSSALPARLSRSRHTGIFLVLLAATVPLFANLGGPLLWSDEADTAVFARNILDYGVPRAWDGRTFIDSDRGERLDSDLVMVGTPWVPFYLTATSFALLGESALAARLPFALAGLGTVALLYLLVLRVTGDRRAALASAVLLVLSVQFLLYARESRHYALNMLLSTAMLLAFLRLPHRRFDPWFPLSAVLLYHCHPLPAGATLAALGALTLVVPGFSAFRRPFWIRLPIVLALTVPWAFAGWSGWGENSTLLGSVSEVPPRLGQFLIEATVAIPVVGWQFLIPWTWWRFTRGDRVWLVVVSVLLGCYAASMVLALSTMEIWVTGLRHCCGLLPLCAGVTGVLVARAAPRSRAAFAALIGIFGLTHLLGLALPWMFLDANARPTPSHAAVHVPHRLLDKVFRTEWVGFALGLVQTSPGSTSRIIDFLRENAGPDDVVVTNYDWEPIYFYTKLPQGMKIMPGFPIYPTARKLGLPEYVFSTRGARWVAWRPAWDGYNGYSRLEEIRAELDRRGLELERVASFRETVWENRPTVHFRRFPGVGHLYFSPAALDRPLVSIYRVASREDAALPSRSPRTRTERGPG